MPLRDLTSGLLALCLILTGAASVVAETRSAATGATCGPTASLPLPDAGGAPVIAADGTAVAAPDCPACHPAIAPADPPILPPRAFARTPVAVAAAPAGPAPRFPRPDIRARAPPVPV